MANISSTIAGHQKESIMLFVQGNIEEEELRRILKVKDKGRTEKPKKQKGELYDYAI